MEFQAVVMAAGRGSRITDLTAGTPKALLPVANKPLICYPLQMLDRAGFKEVLVVVLESAQNAIIKAVTQSCNLQFQPEFVAIPDKEDWGTADSLRHIRSKVKRDILVVSCDLITDLPLHLLADVHRTHDATVTMLLAPALDIAEAAVPGGKANRKIEKDFVGFDGNGNRVLFLSAEADFEESVSFKKSFLKRHPFLNIKTRLMDSHLYLMKRWVLDFLIQERSIGTIKGEFLPYLVKKQFSKSKNKRDLPKPDASVLSEDSKQDILSFCPNDEFSKRAQEMSSWNDHTGDMDDCYHGDGVRCHAYVMEGGFCIRANTLVTYSEANRQTPRQLAAIAPGEDVQLVHPSATIAQKSQVGFDTMLGDGTKVAEKVTLKKSVIGSHCTIAEKCKITNSLLMDHVTVEEGCNISGCIISSNAHIGQKCDLKDCLVGHAHNVIPMAKFTNDIIVELERMMEI